jgi:hypothetical protein
MNGKEKILDQLKNNHQQCQNLVLARGWHLRQRSGEIELIKNLPSRLLVTLLPRNSERFSLPRNGSERNSESLLLFLFSGTEFRVNFSSAEGFGTEFREYSSIFVPQNGIPSCFLFRGRVRNGIPRVSVPRNSRNSVGNNHLFCLFRLPRNYFFVGNYQPYSLPLIKYSTWNESETNFARTYLYYAEKCILQFILYCIIDPNNETGLGSLTNTVIKWNWPHHEYCRFDDNFHTYLWNKFDWFWTHCVTFIIGCENC